MTQKVGYDVDIVICIDTTGSMSSIINKAKENALKFYADLQKALEEIGKNIDELRVRVVAFRDYYVDGDQAMKATPFYSLPDQAAEYSAFVNSLAADGGGDEPESSLDALAIAIKSDWNVRSEKKRHVIVVWTDASSLPLEREGSKTSGYPDGMPKNFDELTDMWEGQGLMNNAAKRLILFAPDAESWTEIANNWDNVIHYPSKAGTGLGDIDYATILSTIAESV